MIYQRCLVLLSDIESSINVSSTDDNDVGDDDDSLARLK
jgi:hypothetical protein